MAITSMTQPDYLVTKYHFEASPMTKYHFEASPMMNWYGIPIVWAEPQSRNHTQDIRLAYRYYLRKGTARW